MGEYIYTSRDDIYIIDLQKTAKKIEEAYEAMKEIAENDGKVLFVGTKKQAQEAAEESAVRTGMYFVNERWLGGTLTNFKTIRSRIKRLEEIEKMEADGTFELLPKKEVIKIKKEYDKLNKNLRGIRDMKKLPNALVIVDPRKEEIAIREARKLNIPVFGVVDTNCDPDMVDYVIPGNDDAVRSVKLMIGVLTNAIAEVTGKEMIDYLTDEDKNKVNNKNKKDDKEINEFALEIEKEEKNVKALKKEDELEKKNTEVENTSEMKKEDAVEVDNMTLTELKELAKERGIKGYSKMKKDELLASLK